MNHFTNRSHTHLSAWLASGIASVGLIWAWRKYSTRNAQMAEHQSRPRAPMPSQSTSSLERNFGDDKDRDTVEQASWESFPASDPPAW